MPRKLKITLWVAIGLAIALFALIGHRFPFTPFFATIFACGVLIVYWTQKTIKQMVLKRYLLVAGASAMGILFFQLLHLFLVEELMVMAIFVCPAALIVGAALALRFKVSPQAS
jgi:peptidoglycan/LPS O-acetylase OafA/YrhL